MSSSVHSAASRYGKSLAGCMHHARVAGDEPPQWTAMHAPVLVLNASYEPINVCAARRAIILVLKGVAMMEEANGHYLHSAPLAMHVPSVIRLLEYRRIPHQTRALSRKNILLRDRNTCQYCGKILAAGELTLDHVIPRSRGGASSWENLVACCHTCNRRKGNLLPHESDMKLHARAPRFQPPHQPPHHAHDGPLRLEVAEVSVLLIGATASAASALHPAVARRPAAAGPW